MTVRRRIGGTEAKRGGLGYQKKGCGARYCSDICKKFNISTDTAVNYVSLYLTKAEEMAMARTDMDNFQVHKYDQLPQPTPF